MIGEMVSCFVLLWQCNRKDCIPISLRYFSFYWRGLWEILSGGFSSLLKNGLSSLASVLLNRAARPYGDAAIAAFIVVNRLVHMCQQIYFGIGEGYQTVCSYNYGAQRYGRVKPDSGFASSWARRCWWSFWWPSCSPSKSSLCSAGTIPAVIQYGSVILRAQMATLSLLPVCSTGFVMLQGIGKNRDAAIVGSGRQGLFLVPLILLLPRFFRPGRPDCRSALLGCAVHTAGNCYPAAQFKAAGDRGNPGTGILANKAGGPAQIRFAIPYEKKEDYIWQKNARTATISRTLPVCLCRTALCPSKRDQSAPLSQQSGGARGFW